MGNPFSLFLLNPLSSLPKAHKTKTAGSEKPTTE
nr:MAG TPA: hypothetical protein [Caudoviricetes sp.]